MKLKLLLAAALIAASFQASADPAEAKDKLMGLPHADVAKLVGSWKVKEMEPLTMIYEFQAATMAMHGRNEDGGKTFELTLDADYRTAGENAIWVIGTHPRPVPDGMEPGHENDPSIIGIEFTGDNEATMTVSSDERFTLVKVP